jgi:precorrin-2 dehydrogenase / sirohydrochlorin ferrochelatase
METHISGNLLFPVFLKIDQVQITLIGGGYVGHEKLQALLKNNPLAKVNVIASEIREEIKELVETYPNITLNERPFEPEDLEGVEVLLVATNVPALNTGIRELAKEKGILTNVADTPHLCDFYLGSTVKKGNLKIGISTNGMSPTFAKRFREMLEDSLPEDIDQLLDNLNQIRNSLKGDFNYKVEKLMELTEGLKVNKTV